uniref:Uncharacterized protein n=1 Tax=Picea sitchensis TaxID=3332 RepID=A0A6B9XPZ8_PICSI|nr:hypothetical protein Q903MT_gene4097 [Picea sitchensis]
MLLVVLHRQDRLLYPLLYLDLVDLYLDEMLSLLLDKLGSLLLLL